MGFLFHFLCPEQLLKEFTVWKAVITALEALKPHGEAPSLSQAVNARRL